MLRKWNIGGLYRVDSAFSWSFFLLQSCFLSLLMLRHTVTILQGFSAVLGCTHVAYMLHFSAEYKEDVKEWDHPGKRRGNAINCRLSNYAVSRGSCLHVGISLWNKKNWATAHSMNVLVMSNRLQRLPVIRGILKHTILFKTVCIYFKIFYLNVFKVHAA